MITPVTNFVLFVLPTLGKLEKLKPKQADFVIHKVKKIISLECLNSSILGSEYIINANWEELYNSFKTKNIPPTHYREYYDKVFDKWCLVIELISKDKR
jgi:hypothetical protein